MTGPIETVMHKEQPYPIDSLKIALSYTANRVHFFLHKNISFLWGHISPSGTNCAESTRSRRLGHVLNALELRLGLYISILRIVSLVSFKNKIRTFMKDSAKVVSKIF